jgi:glyoxylase-like metal-dependent hydrolase (beta-lactamase superfamily II)
LWLLLALLPLAAWSQQPDFSKVQVRAEKLSPTVYMLTGEGGNIAASVGDDTVFLVDDQFAPLAPKIRAALAKLSRKPVKFVLNTHWHFDHVGGNESFGKTGAVILAHDNVRKRMSTEQAIAFLGMTTPPSPKAALPVVTFTSEVRLHLNGEEVHLFHVANAHTDGDAIVHFKGSNVIHLGDVFFNKLYPFIDGSSGGSVDGMLAAVDKVLALADDNTRLVPGHGPAATKADLRQYREMLATTSSRVKAMAQQGKTLQDAQAAKPTAEFDGVWGGGFLPPQRFVEMLWKLLGPER